MPLATGMYGQDATHSISMLMGVMIPFYSIAAVIILSCFSETRKVKVSFMQLLKDIFTNPLILGCLAGMLSGVSGFTLPTVVNKPINDLAMTASPLALFLMGGEFKFRSLSNNLWKALSVTVVRLVIVPFAAMLVFVTMRFCTIDLSVLLCILLRLLLSAVTLCRPIWV